MVLKFNLILAISENNGIGYKGSLPWNLRKELSYFSRMTKETNDPNKKNAVVMGRLTWESMPDNRKPLPGRYNIVLSSKKMELKDGAIHCFSLEDAIKILSSKPYADDLETAWIIGGAKVYEKAVENDYCHRIYLTKVLREFPCDVFVNLKLNNGVFKEVDDPKVPKELQEENGIQYKFLVYERMIKNE
ncbi:UNVERIFIED_CONTAM: hypothetical protein PYX00_009887 [Menopon gallinae]|uniref:dihydrofolate reductase n=1 Tax=Menopon gallinae TaxID=328185 RepID=A0AAW2HD35_9NEOP